MKKEIVFKEGFGNPDVGNFSKKKKFLYNLKIVQELAHVKFFDLMVECKLCDREEINFQYTLFHNNKTYVWPGMYYHYIEEHRAIPSVAFQLFIKDAVKDLEEIDDEDCEPTKQGTEGIFNRENHPIVGKFTGQKQFLKQLKYVSKEAESSYLKGEFSCVFCNTGVGSKKLSLSLDKEHWSWPSGYSHYITDHNVIPSSDFIRFIAACYKTLREEEGEVEEPPPVDPKFNLSVIKKVLHQTIEEEYVSKTQASAILSLLKENYTLPSKRKII